MRKLLIVCALLFCEAPGQPARFQTHRDEAVMFPSSSIAVADAIVQRGFTALRCDDRSVGRSAPFSISVDPSTAVRLAVCSVLTLLGGGDLQVPDARYDTLIRCISVAKRVSDLSGSSLGSRPR